MKTKLDEFENSKTILKQTNYYNFLMLKSVDGRRSPHALQNRPWCAVLLQSSQSTQNRQSFSFCDHMIGEKRSSVKSFLHSTHFRVFLPTSLARGSRRLPGGDGGRLTDSTLLSGFFNSLNFLMTCDITGESPLSLEIVAWSDWGPAAAVELLDA